ncbi:MAG: hypothetical protein JEY71_04915 [Sphaerochaeta sp.]|nr:hypothetical protein [Sphaerochaeta sp.]
MKSIMVSSGEERTPKQIIDGIVIGERETGCEDAKHTVGTFSSHFWSKAIPRLDRYHRKGSPDPLAVVDDKDRQRRIINNYEACEGITVEGNIAQGLLLLLGKLHTNTWVHLT